MAFCMLYRNNLPINTIDKDCLWKRQGNTMVLVDDDQFITYPFSSDDFYMVEM